MSRAARRAVQRAYGHVREISFKPSLACRKTKRLLKARLIVRTFTTTLWSHAQVAAAFFRMLPNASRTSRAGTGTSGPQSVTCPSGQGALLTHPF